MDSKFRAMTEQLRLTNSDEDVANYLRWIIQSDESKNYRSSKTKIADTADNALEIQETYSGKPHGWIQWKGTNVCMDVYCKCGYHSHIDADFAYNVKCPNCGTIYMCNGHIEIIEIKQEPNTFVVCPELDD